MLTFKIENQALIRLDTSKIIGDTRNVVKGKIFFDSEWDGFTNTIHFMNGNDVKSVLNVQHNVEFTIPWEVLHQGNLRIYVEGYSGDTRLLTAPAAPVRIYPSGYFPPLSQAIEHTKSLFEQVMAKFQTTENRVDDLYDDVEEGIFDGKLEYNWSGTSLGIRRVGETAYEYSDLKGATGNGISSIVKTSTSGKTDTYTITFTNGNTTTYNVTNGISITNAAVNSSGHLIITFDNGTTADAGAVSYVSKILSHISPLPDGYRQTEFIGTTGTQAVASHSKANQNTRVVIKFKVADTTSTNYIFGSRISTTSNAFFAGTTVSGKWYLGFGNNTPVSIGEADTDIHEIDFNKNNVYLDGTLLKSFDAVTFETPSAIRIGAIRGENSSNYYFGRVKIYSYAEYSDGTLTDLLIPAIRESDNAIGLYNTVRNEFKANEKTGTLLCGDTISVEKNLSDILTLKSKTEKLESRATTAEGEIDALQTSMASAEDDIDGLQTAVADVDVIPDYVKTEADRVSENVRNVQTGKTITFVGISDLHYNVDDSTTIKALNDMRLAVKEIAKQVHLDFYACFGDIIYRLAASPNFNKGKREILAATKLINDAFGNNLQVRMVGNHDPNGVNGTQAFTKEYLNSFTGIYDNFITKNENIPYGAYGYYDFDRQKVRLIVLNTSVYTSPDLGETQYSFGPTQAMWLCQTLDLSNKSDASDWSIIITSHVALDTPSQISTIGKYSKILNAYEKGTTVIVSDESAYDFAGKNSAKLSLYINGHSHKYTFGNMKYILSDGTESDVLSMARVGIPAASNDNSEERLPASIDGIRYTKTANTANSTAFEIITVDVESKTAYFHRYGAGIDITMHYQPLTVLATQTLTTALTSPTWTSLDTTKATVAGGTVTAVANGNSMIYAKGSDGNIEVWNISVAGI